MAHYIGNFGTIFFPKVETSPNLVTLHESELPDGIHIFKPKISIWVNVGRALQWKMLVYFYSHLIYFTEIWYILCTFGIYFMVIWYIFSHFGLLYQEKSGNPGTNAERAWLPLHRATIKPVTIRIRMGSIFWLSCSH
jgi:hypothetical protein